MQYYPLFLDIRGTRCLIVGAGNVGLRKASGLLECDPALVLVLDTAPLSSAWDALTHDTRFAFAQRPFTADDVRGCALVFAATSSRAVNATVHAACVEHGVLCNVADAPKESRFIVPSCARHARLTVALSTGGASPALARKMRRDFEQRLRVGYAPLADVLARLRPLVLALESNNEVTLAQPTRSARLISSIHSTYSTYSTYSTHSEHSTHSENAENSINSSYLQKTVPSAKPDCEGWQSSEKAVFSNSQHLLAGSSVLSSSCSPATALASSSLFVSTEAVAESENVSLIGQEARAALFRAVADSGLADSLARGDRAECEALLRHTLPKVLHAHITELLYGLA